MTPRDRFWAKIDRSGSCWLWTGAQVGVGYGGFNIDGGLRLVHRIAFEELIGPIPPGFVLDHLCETKLCVNPDHLRAVTQRENILRGSSPSARNARKTHCPAGHPYDGVNTYVYANGRRRCRTCHRNHARRYRAHAKVDA